MYKLNCEIYDKSKEIGLHIFASDNPKKKLKFMMNMVYFFTMLEI